MQRALKIFRLQAEVTDSVAVADALNDLLKRSVSVGILTVFHPVAHQITQNPAEVVMTGIAQERTGVGQHTDKVAKQT